MVRRFIAVFLLPLALCAAEKGKLGPPSVYSGMCDASAAVAVSSNLFLAASDENNVLRLYNSDHAGPPVKSFDLTSFLETTSKSGETDLEAAALLGNRAFWMGSHGRNKDGKLRPDRCRFFATDFAFHNGELDLTPVGNPYKTLLADLNRDSRFAAFHLDLAAMLPPKRPDALNIEGLAGTPDGHLLIGFRNPTPGELALIIPLLNPNEVVEGREPHFGDPIRLDLDDLGIRDMTCCQGHYLIIAGEQGPGGDFRLYRWEGVGKKPVHVKVKHFDRFTPEAIIFYPDRGADTFQILSDDGTRPVDGLPCKEITDPGRQIFRSCWLSLD